MTTATTNQNVIISTAINLLKDGKVRLHRSVDKPTVSFRHYRGTCEKFQIPTNFEFVDLVNSIYAQSGDFSNEFSVSLTGLLMLAKALHTSDRISIQDVQNNNYKSSEWLEISDEDIILIEEAFHPWTSIEDGSTENEVAAKLYQRRMRRRGLNNKVEDTQSAYSHLAAQILQRFKNEGEFRASREDYREAKKILS